MKVSMVSLSRWASPPHLGHFTFMNSGTFTSGDLPFPVIGMPSGSTTGRSFQEPARCRIFGAVNYRIGVPQ